MLPPWIVDMLKQNEADSEDFVCWVYFRPSVAPAFNVRSIYYRSGIVCTISPSIGRFSLGEYKFYPVKGNQWKFREKLKKEFPQIDKSFFFALHILKDKFLPQTDYSVVCGGPAKASSVLSHPQYPNPVAFFCYKHVDRSSSQLSGQSKIFFIQVRVKVHKSHHQYKCQQQSQN